MSKVIFKYGVVDGFALIPEGARIIRQDHVDDGFYKGDFVWAIVDRDSKPSIQHKFIQDKELIVGTFMSHRLAVKEKQTINCSKPVAAKEVDGNIYIYSNYDCNTKQDWKIAVYKTGQDIDLDVDKLEYLGLNRLWIVQELGLYTFLVHE